MDKKPEPPAEDDSPGRSMPGAACADAPAIDLIDPGSLLCKTQLDALRTHADSAMRVFASAGVTGEARIEIVNDDRMSAMHEAHKNTPGTTDVLTFDLAPDNDSLLDADVLICVDEAARQASERGHDLVSELMLYIVHALLHCTGYDDTHDGVRGATEMHSREDEILTAIGLGAVYHTQSTESRS